MIRRLPALLICCLLALSFGLAACGGDEDEDVTELLAQTFGGEGEDVKSGRIGANLRISGLANAQGPVGLRLSGPFASTKQGELPRFDFNVAVETGGQAVQVGAVSTGSKGFVRFQDKAYAVSDALFKQFKEGYAQQAKCNEDKGGGGVSFQTLGIDPRRWLRESSKAGTEEVGGATTIHITSAIDVPKFLEDVNRVLGRADLQREDPCAEGEEQPQPDKTPTRRLSAETRRQIAEAVKDARIDVWTGEEDKILRRLNVVLRYDVPAKDRRRASGLTRGDMRFDLTIGGVNEEQDIKAPANTEPLEALLERFGGQVPGLGGGAGATPAPSPAPGGSGSSSSKYQQCVAEAGQDVAKLQACADLIGS